VTTTLRPDPRSQDNRAGSLLKQVGLHPDIADPGRCNRALTCPYTHDPLRVAICPKFLRGTCPNTPSTCPLSHSPNPHNTPSCIHFQATSSCRNGSSCIYPHVKVAEDAPVCEAFARGGWCDQPAGTCPELHVWECGEWRSTGTCSRGAKCGLRHVLRAEGSRPRPAEEGGFDEQDDFIGLDHGTPADPSDSEESESEEESDLDVTT
jgi:hypothetical protein